MARPRTYEEDSRAHLAFRYDKELIRLFDAIARKQGMTRNQAIDICIKQVIQNGRIPDSYFPELQSKLAQGKAEYGDGHGKSRVKDRLLDGQSANKTARSSSNKGGKITQSI